MKWSQEYNFTPFVLGTAQLGLPYGIANSLGQPSETEAKEIVETALSLGIRSFDTASQYGSSERLLGRFLQARGLNKEALIVTKLPTEAFADESTLFDHTDQSLSNLASGSVFGLMAHSAELLQDAPRISRLFKRLKYTGRVRFTGVSVYSPDEAAIALEHDHFDLIQMPLNALDLRPIEAGLIVKAERQNRLLLFRSTFLQGLLLLDPRNVLPPNVAFAQPILKQWWQLCSDFGVSPKQAALQIAKTLAGPFPLVIGAESAQQLRENVALLKMPLPELDELINSIRPISQSCTEELLSPSLWTRR